MTVHEPEINRDVSLHQGRNKQRDKEDPKQRKGVRNVHRSGARKRMRRRFDRFRSLGHDLRILFLNSFTDHARVLVEHVHARRRPHAECESGSS